MIYLIWIVLYIGFFSLNKINLSEYYLNGLNILWIACAAVILAKTPRVLAAVVLTAFLGLNLKTFFEVVTSGVGSYSSRKAIVNYIREDAQAHDYPCIAVSYITNPGYEFGYRYWFWLAGLHVNQPKSGSPVYTIVFPHSLVDRLDKTFGPLGVILPDYSRYNKQAIDQSCSGEDANLTDSMFGFTK